MKKNQRIIEQEQDIEILKAVAQAWHGHSSASKTSAKTETSEFDAHRRSFKGKPTRFRLEAMRENGNNKKDQKYCGRSWDFRKSLWDSYEIVSVSKKLETGLVLMSENSFSGKKETDDEVGKRRKESKNSLRNLLNRISSRRFTDELPSVGD